MHLASNFGTHAKLRVCQVPKVDASPPCHTESSIKCALFIAITKVGKLRACAKAFGTNGCMQVDALVRGRTSTVKSMSVDFLVGERVHTRS